MLERLQSAPSPDRSRIPSLLPNRDRSPQKWRLYRLKDRVAEREVGETSPACPIPGGRDVLEDRGRNRSKAKTCNQEGNRISDELRPGLETRYPCFRPVCLPGHFSFQFSPLFPLDARSNFFGETVDNCLTVGEVPTCWSGSSGGEQVVVFVCEDSDAT